MTVRLMREVLDEMGVHYNKTSKKAELIRKVKEVRKEKNNVADCSTSRQGKEMQSGSVEGPTTSQHQSCPLGAQSTIDYNEKFQKRAIGWVPYYNDEKRKKLLHLLFLLEMLGYLYILTYLYVVTTIQNVMCMLGSIYLVLVLTQILRLLFASFLFASVNLVSFLYRGNEYILPMDCR